MRSSARILCTGIATLDQVWQLPDLPQAPGKYIATSAHAHGGGMAATASVAVASLGGSAAWCGRLGGDAVGERLLADLHRLGVDCTAVTVAPQGATPHSAVLVDPEGERMLAVFPGADLPDDAPTPVAVVDSAQAVLADPRWPSGAERVFAMAAARGLPRVLDADLAPRDVLHRLAAAADHVIFSQRGLLDFIGSTDARRGLVEAAQMLHGIVAVTLGAEGSLWWHDGTVLHQPAPRVGARDTTGCGDVFHGAYALAIAEGAATMAAARFASAAAALKARNGRGWNGMPGRGEVEALLREPW